jgi:hypothetical protein
LQSTIEVAHVTLGEQAVKYLALHVKPARLLWALHLHVAQSGRSFVRSQASRQRAPRKIWSEPGDCHECILPCLSHSTSTPPTPSFHRCCTPSSRCRHCEKAGRSSGRNSDAQTCRHLLAHMPHESILIVFAWSNSQARHHSHSRSEGCIDRSQKPDDGAESSMWLDPLPGVSSVSIEKQPEDYIFEQFIYLVTLLIDIILPTSLNTARESDKTCTVSTFCMLSILQTWLPPVSACSSRFPIVVTLLFRYSWSFRAERDWTLRKARCTRQPEWLSRRCEQHGVDGEEHSAWTPSLPASSRRSCARGSRRFR